MLSLPGGCVEYNWVHDPDGAGEERGPDQQPPWPSRSLLLEQPLVQTDQSYSKDTTATIPWDSLKTHPV